MTDSSSSVNNSPNVVELLRRLEAGDRLAVQDLFRVIYAEVRRIAERELRERWDRQTLETTALVEEVYRTLADGEELEPRSRAQFFAVAAYALRRALADYARRRLAAKRGTELALTTLTAGNVSFSVELAELPALDEALKRLEKIEPRLRRVVEYRFFGGLSPKEVGGLLGMNERAVERDWVRARAWLYKELYPEEAP